jgi:hypothetical protein
VRYLLSSVLPDDVVGVDVDDDGPPVFIADVCGSTEGFDGCCCCCCCCC